MAMLKSKCNFRHHSISQDNDPEYECSNDSNCILNGEDKNVILTVHRDDNCRNVIVYRANTIQTTDAFGNKSISIDPKKPIDAFWLKMGEKDIKKHRKHGKMDDRVPLNMMEKKMLFGVKSKQIKKNGNKKTRKQQQKLADMIRESDYNQSYVVTLNALKKKENGHQYILRMDTTQNKPYLCGKINIGGSDVECALNSIHVSMKKCKVPKISFITIKAERCDNGQSVEGYVW